MKYRVILFQRYLRQFVLNFGKGLKYGEFLNTVPSQRTHYKMLPAFNEEVRRVKTNWLHWLRRILGIPNVRVRFERQGEIFFTYGSLLLTNKPYFPYLETGLSLYSYDAGIARNPIARLIVMWLATRPQCAKLIFLSQAGKKSFFSTVRYPEKIRKRLEQKSLVIYPVPFIGNPSQAPKKMGKQFRILFVGQFYMKGGWEAVHAFERLSLEYSNVSLTIVTPVQTLKKEDAEYLKRIPGLRLQDAVLDGDGMQALYETHDIFCLPTYREGFGLVLIEALAHGLPLIITDQYATSEMAKDGYNGFIFWNHPLKDYDPQSYRILGKYYNPKVFYADLFRLQAQGKMKPIEDFLYHSLKRFLKEPSLLEQFSRNSLALYHERFDPKKLSRELEAVFLEALGKRQ